MACSTKDGAKLELEDGKVQVGLQGVKASASVDVHGEVAELFESTDEELLERLQAESIVVQLVSDLFASADRNKDERITLDEFSQYVKKQGETHVFNDWWGFFEV